MKVSRECFPGVMVDIKERPMKYGIMSDIHGNLAAMDKALSDAKARHCDRLICLGDLTGYGDDGWACVKLARKSFDVCLMGNHDSACCGKEDEDILSMCHSYRKDVAVRRDLSIASRKWLSGLPYVYAEGSFACVHGDFTNPKEWNYVYTPSHAWLSLMERREQFLFFGHVHEQVLMRISAEDAVKMCSMDETLLREGRRGLAVVDLRKIVLKPGERAVVNVGSVGLTRNGPAGYAVYDSVRRSVELISLE